MASPKRRSRPEGSSRGKSMKHGYLVKTPPTVQGREVITLIGSTRFEADYKRVTFDLTMQGKIVVSVGRFGHQDGLEMSGPHKAMLDALHFCKINGGHSVFLINPGGYCGESTSRELCYAAMQGKGIYSLEPVPDWYSEMVREGVFT